MRGVQTGRSRHGRWLVVLVAAIIATLVSDIAGTIHLAGQDPGPAGIVYGNESGLDIVSNYFVRPNGQSQHQLGQFAEGDLSANGQEFLVIPDTRDGEPDSGAEGAPTDIGVTSASGRSHHRVWHVGDQVLTAAINAKATEAAVALDTNIDRSGRLIRPNDPPGLWLVNIRSGAHRRVLRNAEGPMTWSPDGHRLAFLLPVSAAQDAAVALVTTPVNGGPLTRLATFESNAAGLAFDLSWSPDGTTIMLAGQTPDGDEVETYPATGGRRHLLIASNPTTAICSAVWSPDGSQIAVQTQTTTPDPLKRTQVDIGNADGTNFTPIVRQTGSCMEAGGLTWVAHFEH